MIEFNPNCTLPDAVPVFVGNTNIRTTLDIAWSCVSTLLLCCWSIIHLNVPEQFRPLTRGERLRRSLWLFWRRLKWMLFTLLVPEALLAKAMSDYSSAKFQTGQFQAFLQQNRDGVTWSLVHSFFANMGGFAIRFPPSLPAQGVDSIPSSPDIVQGVDEEVPYEATQPSNEATPVPAIVPQDIEMMGNRADPPVSPATGDAVINIAPFAGQVLDKHVEAQKDERPCHQSTQGRTDHDQLQRVARTTGATDEAQALPTDKARSDYRSGWTMRRLKASYEDYWRRVEQIRLGLRWSYEREEYRLLLEVYGKSYRYGPLDWRRNDVHAALAKGIFDTTDAPTYRKPFRKALLVLIGDVWVLNAAQLLYARSCGIIECLPNVSEDDLGDKSKGDVVVKLTALVQVTWIIIQLVGRAAAGSPSAPLEIMTLAFASLALFIYLLLLNRPQGVGTPIYFLAKQRPSMGEMKEIALLRPLMFLNIPFPLSMPNAVLHQGPAINRRGGSALLISSAGMVFGSLAFGAIHLAAWNFIFPSDVERELWRISSLVTALAPLVFTVVQVILGMVNKFVTRFPESSIVYTGSLGALTMFIAIALIPARLLLIVESFRSLYYLPPGTYLSSWTSNIPHVG